ncbi:MAG: hypothetical protein LZF86_190657 [Nitrospira sp.]|nr:MAG: hypothetical protein LZF86_190657 [Nitrospira sp.]
MSSTTGPGATGCGDRAESTVADGRWFCILTVVDQFTRECLCVLADQPLAGDKVDQALAPVVFQPGAPRSITVDKGSEFASRGFRHI